MDNGPEFISATPAEWAENHNIALEFIKLGKLTQNDYMKRLNALFRYEILSLYVFRALYEIREIPRTVGSTDNEE